MLNIELVRFQAQDVITASVTTPTEPPKTVVVPGCTNASGHRFSFTKVDGVWGSFCDYCSIPVNANPGDTVVGGN